MVPRRYCCVALFLLILLGTFRGAAAAQEPAVWQAVDSMRTRLFQAQRELYAADRAADPTGAYRAAADHVDAATARYVEAVQPDLASLAPAADQLVTTALREARAAAAVGDQPTVAAAAGRVWTGLLWGSYTATLAALDAGDGAGAADWIRVREYRRSTAVSLVDDRAVQAIAALQAGRVDAATARTTVDDDLRDTYFFRFREAIDELESAAGLDYVARTANWAGHLRGYFSILRDDFATKQGPQAAAALTEALIAVERAAVTADLAAVERLADAIRARVAGYQPVELSAELVAERGQLLYLFIDLVYIEYKDGVRNGQISIPIEYQETITFREQAEKLFEELRPTIAAADPAAAERLATLLAEMEVVILDIGDKAAVKAMVEEALGLVETSLNVQVDAGDPSASFAVMDTLLDDVLVAARQGRYEDAERTRLEAYALFESGAEQRLANRAPRLTREIEGLFWEGTGGKQGLAGLLRQEAPPAAIAVTIAQLKTKLADAGQFLAAGLSWTFAAINSAVIIIREGLEAVLIIGAILGYLRSTGSPRQYSLWMYLGVLAALALSLLTWWAARSLITISAANRELIEGVTSLIAVVVLFYVTNWLFHKVYVVDWLTFVREQAQKALTTGSALVLAGLGFTVVYREGFETVLFYQALLFDAEAAAVWVGFLVGSVIILGIAYAILRMSKRLPLKPFFTVTGVLLLLLAFSFTGAGIRELQEAGLINATLVAWVPEHIVLMEALGIFPTLETTLAQMIFVCAVIGTFGYSRWRGRVAPAGSVSQTKRLTER